MPYQVTPEVNFASVGLITDMPAHETPIGAWTDCLNIRIKDGSIQGVNSFGAAYSAPAGETVVAVTQWTPAGSSHLNIAYVTKDVSNNGKVYVLNTQTLANEDVTNQAAELQFTIDEDYPPQLFVFNGLLIMNPATSQPQYISADETTVGTLAVLPNWLQYAGPTPATVRIMRPFKNRLVAMSFVDTNTDSEYPIDFAWSSHITTLDSLTGADWQAASTNTAGDAFLTQTPGRILDGGQLGEFFIAYKSDAVIRVYETGDSFVLGFDSIFEDDGIYSTRCFANIGDAQHLVIGNYGVYIHDGQSQRQDIAKGLFQDTMYNLVSTADRDKSFVFQQTRDKEVWFCFKQTGATETNADRAFVFNYADQKLHIRSLPDLSDIYETEVDGELKIYGAAATGILQLSNTDLESGGWFESIQEALDNITAYKDISQVYPSAQGAFTLAIQGSAFPVDSAGLASGWSYKTFDPLTQFKSDHRVSGRFLNIRVQMSTTVNPKLTTMQFKVRPSGFR